MPVSKNRPCPYAPSTAILEFVGRARTRGIPGDVDSELLVRIGVPESLIARTLQALQTLDLINKDGVPTQILVGLMRAPEAEYREKMVEWIKGAYAEIFLIVDPSKDETVRIRDAFRGYEPMGQQERMVSLFQGLCEAAGISKKSARKAASTSHGETLITPRMRTHAKRFVAERFKDGPKHPPRGLSAMLPAPLAGLLEKLPAEGDSWSKAERDKFVVTFQAVLDFSFPVVESIPEEEPKPEAVRRRVV